MAQNGVRCYVNMRFTDEKWRFLRNLQHRTGIDAYQILRVMVNETIEVMMNEGESRSAAYVMGRVPRQDSELTEGAA